jgi:hypothetical protein
MSRQPGPVLRPYSPCPRPLRAAPRRRSAAPGAAPRGGEGPDDPITPVHGGRDLDTRTAVERQRHHDRLLSEPLDVTRFGRTGTGRQGVNSHKLVPEQAPKPGGILLQIACP